MLDPATMLAFFARASDGALRYFCACLLVCAVGLLGPAAVLAQDSAVPSQDGSARPAPAGYDELIKHAVVEFDNSHWAEARALFGRAHELSPNARTFRGLGITAFELRRYVDAAAELEAALAEANKPLTAKQREEVQGLLARARDFIAVVTLEIQPSHAQLFLDGAPTRPNGGRVSVDPGQHQLLVQAKGYQDWELALSADPGEKRDLEITLAVLAGPLASRQAAQAAEQAPAPAPPHKKRIWTYILGGAALASLATGVAMRLVASGEHDDYKQCSSGDCEKLRVDGQHHERIAYIAFGVAGGFAVASITAFVLEGRAKKDSSLAVTRFHVQPFGAAISHRF